MKKKIIIGVKARLHINSLDMNGCNGRCCGGVGLYLAQPEMKVYIEFCEKQDRFISRYPGKVTLIVGKIRKHYGIKRKLKITVVNEFEEHVGLGSETQLSLAIGEGILRLVNIEIDYQELSQVLNFGGVSGIGYWSYRKGGLSIDGGYETKNDFAKHSKILPPLISNVKFPSDWKILLVTPRNIKSISKEKEDEFFRKYTPVSMSEVYKLVYFSFLGVVNSIAEKNFNNFIKSMAIVSSLGTKKAELKINCKSTSIIIAGLKSEFGFGALSSLGPTCYTFIKKTTINTRKLKKIFPDCDLIITSAENNGRKIYEIT